MADAKNRTADTAGKDLPDLPARRRTNPLQFFGEVRREMSKVTWPTWRETWLTTVMVFIMVGLMMAFFTVVDLLLGMGTNWVLIHG
jgi:preprotein translocase subunit SecE